MTWQLSKDRHAFFRPYARRKRTTAIPAIQQPVNSEKLAFDFDELAKATGLSVRKLADEVKAGRLRPTRCGARVLFSRAAVDAWLNTTSA
jgi:excisionase family DNA binding protein